MVGVIRGIDDKSIAAIRTRAALLDSPARLDHRRVLHAQTGYGPARQPVGQAVRVRQPVLRRTDGIAQFVVGALILGPAVILGVII